VAPPQGITPYYDAVYQNKTLVVAATATSKPKYNYYDFLPPSLMTAEQYLALDNATNDTLANWSTTVKGSTHSINVDMASGSPIKLLHMLVHVAYTLRIWSEYKQVCKHGDMAAAVVNYLLVQNHVLVCIRGRPKHVSPISGDSLCEIVSKAAIEFKETDSWFYQGDGAEENPALAGVGVPSAALTDGSWPSADKLYQEDLHEIEGAITAKLSEINPSDPTVQHNHLVSATCDCINALIAGTNDTSAPDVGTMNIGGAPGTNARSCSSAQTVASAAHGRSTVSSTPLAMGTSMEGTTSASSGRTTPVSTAASMAATTMMSMESVLRDADVQSQSLSYMEKQLEFQQQQFGAST